MADSKLINEHRAWLKDAEKGKTRACILAIALFVFYSACAIINFNIEAIEMTGFMVFIVMVLALVGSLVLFNGYNAGKIWVLLCEIILVLSTFFSVYNNEHLSTSQQVLICVVEFVPPLFGLGYAYINFYMRRYFGFMVLYRAKKIYL
ncbi:MAG: hypothetical protein E7478_03895 [Ruminococcaceae bacterium]|nr:hypothetical protein [Oscillospiraceae bacterium]